MNWHGYCVSEIVGLAMQGARNGDVAQRDIEVIPEGIGLERDHCQSKYERSGEVGK